MALFQNGLLPASFRGVPFAVTASGEAFGRRIALHQYPGRDEPWAEDMGRAPRRYTFRGFLVTDDQVYIGGPVQLQRLLLIAALEQAGSGTLTHPTLGVLTVAVVSARVGEALDAGRYSELELEFVEAGKQQFPSLLTGSGGLLSAATLATVAIVADVARALVIVGQAVSGPPAIPPAAAAWSGQATGLGQDATALYRLAAVLPGNFGRYSQGSNVGYTASAYAADFVVSDLVADAADQRSAIGAAAAVVATAAAIDLPAAAIALVSAVAGACADPADAIRLLTRLGDFDPMDDSDAATAVANLFRWAAAVQLATIAAAYQPSSYDDAQATLTLVAGLLDDQATAAADAGFDATFQALRALRAEVITDLRARGASLAPIRTFDVSAPLPAAVLAQRFYRDPLRADQLVRQAAPVHPLFMPTEFQALAA